MKEGAVGRQWCGVRPGIGEQGIFRGALGGVKAPRFCPCAAKGSPLQTLSVPQILVSRSQCSKGRGKGGQRKGCSCARGAGRGAGGAARSRGRMEVGCRGRVQEMMGAGWDPMERGLGTGWGPMERAGAVWGHIEGLGAGWDLMGGVGAGWGPMEGGLGSG